MKLPKSKERDANSETGQRDYQTERKRKSHVILKH